MKKRTQSAHELAPWLQDALVQRADPLLQVCRHIVLDLETGARDAADAATLLKAVLDAFPGRRQGFTAALRPYRARQPHAIPPTRPRANHSPRGRRDDECHRPRPPMPRDRHRAGAGRLRGEPPMNESTMQNDTEIRWIPLREPGAFRPQRTYGGGAGGSRARTRSLGGGARAAREPRGACQRRRQDIPGRRRRSAAAGPPGACQEAPEQVPRHDADTVPRDRGRCDRRGDQRGREPGARQHAPGRPVHGLPTSCSNAA